MSYRMTAIAAVSAIAFLAMTWPGKAQQPQYKVTVFGIPTVNNDSVWMAMEKGFYKAEGLDLTLRLFPSGTTGLQAFQTGQGDIVLSGDLPSVQYHFRVNGNYSTIVALERDSKGYVVAALKTITKPQDLIGKTVATRVGSNGSWFLSEYLTKNNVDPTKVTIKNLDTQILPAALCSGDISAFFIWQPAGTRAMEICPDKVHILGDAQGYMQGYTIVGARRDWLDTAQGKEIAIRFLRATLKGKEVAEKDFAAVAAYTKAKFDLSESATRADYDIADRVFVIDKIYYDDFCSISRWAQREKLNTEKIDFNKLTWVDGLKEIDPKRVDAPPPPC
ncbi:ABC transporter substrate-binding protein [Bradyrhizobium sp. 187]|uniref:ABC transporter substrate-binding protein n=1 Tax=Bradyrhizobium sp. 187 TaxID=2782655 RepID=UPI001FFE38C5|nr:ABC transporter substrate-binding protein [Bradyrhizobium sp. 187]UPJ71892.1 ABC transporter substrate-binding protein [Bradyrhizobium sp. 187]